MIAEFKMLSSTASRTIELDGNTCLDSVVASRPTRRQREPRLSVARFRSAGTGSGLDTQRSELAAHLSVDSYTYTLVPAQQQQRHAVTLENTKYQDKFTFQGDAGTLRNVSSNIRG